MDEMKNLQKVEFKGDEEVDIEKLTNELVEHNKNSTDRLFVRTSVTNSTQKTVFRADTHFWHGHTSYSNPRPLPPRNGDDYPQFGTPPEGVKYGFVYADGDDSLSRKFVVAVHVPLPAVGSANKVYVESGPIGPVDWNVIEVKLNMSTVNKAVFDDPIFKGRVEAQITNQGYYTFIIFRN